jgi:hypothetical protein
MCTVTASTRTWRELGKQYCRPDESDHIAQVAKDERPSSTQAINKHNAGEFAE